MKIVVFKFALIFFLLINFLHAKPDYFSEGINLYKKEKFKEAQFKFEQEIVFNPKSELSYLYLSKIFNKLDKIDLEEQNLNTVMLFAFGTNLIYSGVSAISCTTRHSESKSLPASISTPSKSRLTL